MHTWKYRNFLRLAAICSVLGAVTTALLLFLPNPVAADFEARAQLSGNALYLTKLWILFFHPQFNLIAALGVAYLLFRKYPLRIITGTLFLAIWAYTEMAQQAFLIDALNQIWRPAYLDANDELTKNSFQTLITGAQGISDSQYFLVIYGFGLGTLLYGAALTNEAGLGKWLGIALIFIGVLSLASFVRYFLGLSVLSPAVDAAYTNLYPYLQPAVRIGLGFWIWRAIQKEDYDGSTQQ